MLKAKNTVPVCRLTLIWEHVQTDPANSLSLEKLLTCLLETTRALYGDKNLYIRDVFTGDEALDMKIVNVEGELFVCWDEVIRNRDELVIGVFRRISND